MMMPKVIEAPKPNRTGPPRNIIVPDASMVQIDVISVRDSVVPALVSIDRIFHLRPLKMMVWSGANVWSIRPVRALPD